MHVHIALYQWKPSASEEEVQQALAEVEALADKVPGIVEITTGRNTSKYGSGYTHVILVRAASQDAINAYRAHPDHVSVAQKIDLIEQHGIGVDFTSDTAPTTAAHGKSSS